MFLLNKTYFIYLAFAFAVLAIRPEIASGAESCSLVSVINRQSVSGLTFTQVGVGWIVRNTRQANRVYVLTPAHVSFGINNSSGFNQELVVRCGSRIARARVHASSSTLDLSLLAIETPTDFSTTPLLAVDPNQVSHISIGVSPQSEIHTVGIGHEPNPTIFPIRDVTHRFPHQAQAALVGQAWPIELKVNAVQPGYSGSALIADRAPVGMITRTGLNDSQSYAISMNDIGAALPHLFAGRDPWAAYSERDPHYLSIIDPLDVARVSSRARLRSFAALEFNLRFDAPTRSLVRERSLVIRRSNQVIATYTDLCGLGSATTDTTGFALAGRDSLPVGRNGEVGDSGRNGEVGDGGRNGEVGDGGNGSTTPFGTLVFTSGSSEVSSFYKFLPSGDCRDGVRTPDGRILTAVLDPANRIARRVSGIEDLFSIASRKLTELASYLNTNGIYLDSPRSLYTPFCHESVLGPNLAILPSSSGNQQNSLMMNGVRQLIAQEGYIALPTTQRAAQSRDSIRCSSDRKTVEIRFRDVLTQINGTGLRLEARLSDEKVEGHVSVGRCRIELNSATTVRHSGWITEVRHPDLHVKISLDTHGDLLKTQVLAASQDCVPQGGDWDALWLMVSRIEKGSVPQ